MLSESQCWEWAFLALLLSVVNSDFKRREVTLWQLLLLVAVAVGNGHARFGFEGVFDYFALNTFFLIIQFAVVWGWFALKNRHWSGFIDQYIGIGDGLFLLALTPALAPISFVWFYTTGMFSTLVIVLIVKSFRPKAFQTIPLAGSLAVWLIFWQCIERYFHIGF